MNTPSEAPINYGFCSCRCGKFVHMDTRGRTFRNLRRQNKCRCIVRRSSRHFRLYCNSGQHSSARHFRRHMGYCHPMAHIFPSCTYCTCHTTSCNHHRTHRRRFADRRNGRRNTCPRPNTARYSISASTRRHCTRCILDTACCTCRSSQSRMRCRCKCRRNNPGCTGTNCRICRNCRRLWRHRRRHLGSTVLQIGTACRTRRNCTSLRQCRRSRLLDNTSAPLARSGIRRRRRTANCLRTRCRTRRSCSCRCARPRTRARRRARFVCSR